ncbi:MAG: V-type ATP synthase subunit E family protein [Nitrosopumilus sp.]|nr:V-type ATP synthase subunit E family protein [Nitrosopumilus sp.]MDA7942416.1 V-type ATP synthase subunit E family protein [Nitrosopumilus sp.]MDA7953690.1 V-type ATP synthase subunit E family protein [Nitrosopumilus sp.]MDA7957888.1 V-type ATP synthase subunit E family protein [Nitrosopumilus sp.]MDA7960708.1 V-type ATP synthase subunit E family protein [Nitrosopumilus sp.]
MASNPELERSIDRVVSRAGDAMVAGLAGAGEAARRSLDEAGPSLEAEYDRIISDGKKEADKVSRQLVGGAELAARNRELVALEEAVDRVFERALEQVAGADHSKVAARLLEEAARTLGTDEMVVSTNAASRGAVEAALSGFKGASLSPDAIDCMGGVVARAADGSMEFDNTIDARVARMKPLIRKEIAAQFGVGV